MAVLKKTRIAFCALGFLLLVSCSPEVGPTTTSDAAPTRILASPSIQKTVHRNPTVTAAAADIITPALTKDSTRLVDVEGAPTVEILSPTIAPTAHQQASDGVRPDQAVQQWEAEPIADSDLDWRPPPLPVPLSLHPDDHYWLARPLASDSRNYDLEWYPYANEPTIPRAQPYRVHHGMDFPNQTGTPIFAASGGTVVWAGHLANYRSGVSYYGNTVIIHHDWRWQGRDVYTLYAHTLELFVEVGDHVEQGQLIAGVGASGEVSGPHLHLEVRVGTNSYNETRNPALWLAPFEGWGTLAGRFVDNEGQPIHGAAVTVRPLKVDTTADIAARHQRTYSPFGVNIDDVWQENFVVADLPAGEYTLFLETGGNQFRRNVQILPGQTNFVIVQADFQFVPTSTPTPTYTPSLTGTITATLSSEPLFTPTIELTSTP